MEGAREECVEGNGAYVNYLRYLLSEFLFGVCYAFDSIPGRWDGRWHRYGDWGCWPLRISTLAIKVDPYKEEVRGGSNPD